MKYRNYVKLIPLVLIFLGIFLFAACRSAPAQGWSGATVEGGILYLGAAKGKVVAYDSSNGDPKWQASIQSTAQTSSFGCAPPAVPSVFYGNPAADGDSVYVGTYEGMFYAMNASNGAIRWQYPKIGRIGAIVGSPLVHQGAVYFGSSDGKIYALNTANGLEKWAFETGGKVWATPVIKGNKLFAGSFDGNLYALEPSSGSLIWKFKSKGAITATALVVSDTVYIGSFDHYLYAINTDTGQEKWAFRGEGWFWDAPAIYSNILIAGNVDHKVYGIDANSGKTVWSQPYETKGAIRSSPVIAGDIAIVASDDKTLYFLKASNGTEIRKISLGSPVLASLTVNKGIVYVYTQQGLLIAFNAENGTRVWEVSTIT
jgi:outer membrane protein assembly factor BamB